MLCLMRFKTKEPQHHVVARACGRKLRGLRGGVVETIEDRPRSMEDRYESERASFTSCICTLPPVSGSAAYARRDRQYKQVTRGEKKTWNIKTIHLLLLNKNVKCGGNRWDLPELTVFLVLIFEQYASMTSRIRASSLYVTGLRLVRIGVAPSARQGLKGGAGRRLQADQPPRPSNWLLKTPPWRVAALEFTPTTGVIYKQPTLIINSYNRAHHIKSTCTPTSFCNGKSICVIEDTVCICRPKVQDKLDEIKTSQKQILP